MVVMDGFTSGRRLNGWTRASMNVLQYLRLSGNQLKGSLPIELGLLTELKYLGLYHNQLKGSIPSELGGLTKLRIFNQLTSSIPSSLCTNRTLIDIDCDEIACDCCMSAAR